MRRVPTRELFLCSRSWFLPRLSINDELSGNDKVERDVEERKEEPLKLIATHVSMWALDIVDMISCRRK